MPLSKVVYETMFGDTTISIVVDKESGEDGLPIGIFSGDGETNIAWMSAYEATEFAELLNGLAVAAIRLQDQGEG
ncbi:MAG: hypothetical protein GY702_08620 [Desulfobulbaceae bacterium]|nr:hypothetical protein [Desulfobulbaceae bacterium]